jgi:hypothetical protein
MAAELDSYGIVTPRGGSLSDNAKEFVGIVRGMVRERNKRLEDANAAGLTSWNGSGAA